MAVFPYYSLDFTNRLVRPCQKIWTRCIKHVGDWVFRIYFQISVIAFLIFSEHHIDHYFCVTARERVKNNNFMTQKKAILPIARNHSIAGIWPCWRYPTEPQFFLLQYDNNAYNVKHKFMEHTSVCDTRLIQTNDITVIQNTAKLLVVQIKTTVYGTLTEIS